MSAGAASTFAGALWCVAGARVCVAGALVCVAGALVCVADALVCVADALVCVAGALVCVAGVAMSIDERDASSRNDGAANPASAATVAAIAIPGARCLCKAAETGAAAGVTHTPGRRRGLRITAGTVVDR